MSEDKLFYSAKDIAQMFGVTTWTVREWIKTGYIEGAVKIGQKWMVSKSDLQEFLRSRHG